MATTDQLRELDERYRAPALFRHRAAVLFDCAERLRAGTKGISRKVVNAPTKERDGDHVVILMLVGMAIEVALKALVAHDLLQGGKQPAEVRARIGVLDHFLRKAASEAALPFSGEEAKLLDTLEACIRWAGRYAAPKQAARLPTPADPLAAANFRTTYTAAARYYKRACAAAKARTRALKVAAR